MAVALKEQVTEPKSKNNSREVILSKNRLRDTGQLIHLNAKKPAENNDMENGNNCLLNSLRDIENPHRLQHDNDVLTEYVVELSK